MNLRNKRILVTGGAGSIGSELVRQLVPNNKIFILDISETEGFGLAEELKPAWVHFRLGDIRNKETIEDIFSDFKPQVIFHAAALKHVSPNEKYPREAVETNVLGTLNLVEVAKHWSSTEKLIFISTDKAVQMSSVMGGTKRLGELIVRNAGYISVRFGNVMGSRGSVIPIWQKQLEQGKPITVTDPRMERYMMTIPQAVGLVIKAAEMGKGGEIFILDMGKPIKVLDLAKKIVEESDGEIKLTGIRPGEMLTEKLMFDEEKAIAQKVNNFWIIK